MFAVTHTAAVHASQAAVAVSARSPVASQPPSVYSAALGRYTSQPGAYSDLSEKMAALVDARVRSISSLQRADEPKSSTVH